MLSVLIPTYNYDCRRLASDLAKQLAVANTDYELIVADDGSTDKDIIEKNKEISDIAGCKIVRKEKNIGRAAIRNFLVEEARGEWLIFIDNDAEVINSDYIQNYLNAINENVDIIVGGMRHADRLPSPDVTLRYRYEKDADKRRGASYRQLRPFQHLTFFNLCVRRQLLLAVPFDENCHEYGYEDALLGVELEHYGARLLHIDNPLLHAGLESNEIYLEKVEKALCTLSSLGEKMVEHSHVGNTAVCTHRYHISCICRFLFLLFRSLMRRNLLGTHPSLFILKLYKLGFFLSIYEFKS